MSTFAHGGATLLQIGDEFLTKQEKERIALQTTWEELYFSSHVHNKIVKVDGQTIDVDPLVPLPNLISEVFSDLIFLEFPKITFDDEVKDDLKPVIDKLAIDCLEAAGLNSATGMLFCNMFNVDGETNWKFMSPTQTLWETDKLGNLKHVIFFKYISTDKKGNKEFHIQEHSLMSSGATTKDGGKTITENKKHVIETYNIVIGPDKKIKNVFDLETINTGLDFIPVIIVWNIGQLKSSIGRSDYQGKEQMFAELDNRYDQVNYVLQEHSEPWTFVPPGVLNTNGQFSRRQGKMVEKAGGGTGDNSVDIVSWDASLQSAFKMIDSLIDTTLFTSRISNSIAGRSVDGVSGGAESGKAVIWKSVQTWTAVKKRQSYWSAFFKQFFLYLGKMDERYTDTLNEEAVNKIGVLWATNLPMDETADTQNLSIQVNSGIKSQKKAISELQNIDDTMAAEEQAQIKTEQEEQAAIDASSTQPVTL
jgi:hypothetical protein